MSEDESQALAQLLEELKKEYAKSLPEKLEALRSAVIEAQTSPTEESLTKARSLAHKLQGTAGSYGFHEVGIIAAQLEGLLLRLSRGLSEELLASLAATLGQLPRQVE